MPYVITTKGPSTIPGVGTLREAVESRRAVATLEEASEACCEIIDAIPGIDDEHRHDPKLQPAYRLSECGGTVGPLPDGTVIEVERVSWLTLSSRVPDTDQAAGWLMFNEWDKVLDAFNARER
jgi:hypothetical protein